MRTAKSASVSTPSSSQRPRCHGSVICRSSHPVCASCGHLTSCRVAARQAMPRQTRDVADSISELQRRYNLVVTPADEQQLRGLRVRIQRMAAGLDEDGMDGIDGVEMVDVESAERKKTRKSLERK